MTQMCITCNEEKTLDQFYMRATGTLRHECKKCFNKNSGKSVTKWRQNAKRKLVAIHGGKCLDCGYIGPAFMYDFDHRDPREKSFNVTGTGTPKRFEVLLAESSM